MKVRFIVNPVAGGRDSVAEITATVREVLSSTFGYFDIKVPKMAGMAGFYSRQARELGFDAVFACGGDGTINEVGSALVGSTTVLGVVPRGSGNGFAISLGIPNGAAEAISAVRKWNTRRIDVGRVCDRFFFSTAGLGFDAHLSKRYNEDPYIKKKRGISPYVRLALSEYLSYRPERSIIKMDNMVTTATPFILTVANTERYGGGAVIAPGALPDDGYVDVCMIGSPGLIGAVKLGYRLMKGKIARYGDYKIFRVQNLEVLRSRLTEVHADGEPFDWGGSVVFGVEHKAISVFAPES